MSEITESAQTGPDTLHQMLVERLVADLRPVRRLWPLSFRLALWIALEAGVLFFIVTHTHRADLAHQIHNTWYLLSVGGFAVSGVFGASLALRAAIPGREPHVAELVFLLVLSVASTLVLLRAPINANLPISTFIDTGWPCALGILMFASLPWLALSWAVRRGAPLSPGLDGAMIGAAAFLCSFSLMRVNCPIDDGLHLLVWHLLPALAGIALSAFVGSLILKRLRRTAAAASRQQ